MLMPKRVKYRKAQRGRMKGKAQRGSTLAFAARNFLPLLGIILLRRSSDPVDAGSPTVARPENLRNDFESHGTGGAFDPADRRRRQPSG